MRKFVVSGAAAAALLFIAGCASQSAPPPAPAPAAAPAAPANSWTARLAALKSDLETSTKGTGVVIEQTTDNQLHVVIPNELSFDTGRSNVKRNLAQVLDKVAEGLKSATAASVRVVGHTDNTGSEEGNERLSVSRADSVRNHLVSRGVSTTVITTDGRGSREPLADNGTAAGRAQNRRVEIFVAEKA
ncbi:MULTISPECIES: OmpA family protein [unclassified Variovorax]|jgi:outer membrane protein OmpA-like peptidoglycan-associated protein|uniref:OmpA family protein n=1 Tax=unclassified Variovorax TaxID=663243 RepID=UPI000F7DDE78|nr:MULTISPECIES: OmpA family protein [unclassified Variovorax]RSZ38388.1 OmpA family protein [Variovorax sp. 553]RSZ39160.1 OmpA family protein [Variovorax sp. 679]